MKYLAAKKEYFLVDTTPTPAVEKILTTFKFEGPYLSHNYLSAVTFIRSPEIRLKSRIARAQEQAGWRTHSGGKTLGSFSEFSVCRGFHAKTDHSRISELVLFQWNP